MSLAEIFKTNLVEMHPTPIEESLLVSYLHGTTNESDSARVEAWYMSCEQNKEQLERLYSLLFISQFAKAKESIDTEAALSAFRKKLADKRRNEIFEDDQPRRFSLGKIIGIAMLAGMFLTGGIIIKKAVDHTSKPLIITTQLGERARITLPDGSSVWLNSCSRIEYSSPLFARERRVEMMGEAYFEVKKDKSPFIVCSNGLNTRVLGTKFNIRANDDENEVIATLFEGSIQSSSARAQGSVTLMPNQQLYYDTRLGTMTLHDCQSNTERYIGWIDGKLHFDQATLAQITTELERYYNVKITFMDESLRNERFSCDFETADNIHHIISTLRLTRKFDYWIKGNDIVIFHQAAANVPTTKRTNTPTI